MSVRSATSGRPPGFDPSACFRCGRPIASHADGELCAASGQPADSEIRPATAAPVGLLVDLIDPNPRNPRHSVGDVRELSESIRTVGVLQPVIVVPAGDRFRLVSGHRRLAAAEVLGLVRIPAIVRDDLDEPHQLAAALAENLARDDLNPVDEAEGYAALIDAGWRQKDIAAQVGRSPALVSKRLRLLELSPRLLTRVRDGSLPVEEAYRKLAKPRQDLNDKAQRPTLLKMLAARVSVIRSVATTVERLAASWDDRRATQLAGVSAALRDTAELLDQILADPGRKS